MSFSHSSDSSFSGHDSDSGSSQHVDHDTSVMPESEHYVHPHHVDGYYRHDGTHVDGYYRDGNGDPNTQLTASEGGGYFSTHHSAHISHDTSGTSGHNHHDHSAEHTFLGHHGNEHYSAFPSEHLDNMVIVHHDGNFDKIITYSDPLAHSGEYIMPSFSL